MACNVKEAVHFHFDKHQGEQETRCVLITYAQLEHRPIYHQVSLFSFSICGYRPDIKAAVSFSVLVCRSVNFWFYSTHADATQRPANKINMGLIRRKQIFLVGFHERGLTIQIINLDFQFNIYVPSQLEQQVNDFKLN